MDGGGERERRMMVIIGDNDDGARGVCVGAPAGEQPPRAAFSHGAQSKTAHTFSNVSGFGYAILLYVEVAQRTIFGLDFLGQGD